MNDHKRVSRSKLAGRPARLWVGLGVIVGGSVVAVWAIFHHHVLIGVVVLVATYAVQLAALWAWSAKDPGQ
jgi:hypothetical protein